MEESHVTQNKVLRPSMREGKKIILIRNPNHCTAQNLAAFQTEDLIKATTGGPVWYFDVVHVP